MAERFTALTRSECRLYTEGSPVVLSAYALLKDNTNDTVLTQLKLTNVSAKQISGVFVKVNAFDLSGAAVQGVEEYQYLDLNAVRGESFGQKKAITMPCNVTRKVEIQVLRVVFADGTVWVPTEDALWEPVPEQETVSAHFGDAELTRQYGMAVGSSHCDYMPKQHKGLTLCTCGAMSAGDVETCRNCQRDFAVLFAVDEEKLASDCAARLAKEKAEREAIEQAAREAAEKAKAEAEVKAKKTKKILSVVVPTALVVILAIVLVTKVFIPNSRYNAALTLKNAGQYEEAIAAFGAMDGYKDSETQIKACRTAIKDIAYNEALALKDAGQYEEAIAAFEALDGYKNSAEQIPECEYLNAVALMDAGQYDEAIAAFEAMDGYKDSAEQVEKCNVGKYGEETWLLLKSIELGSTYTFGSYEQDNDTANGQEEIEWLVLAKEDSRILLISKYGLDCKPYNTKYTSVTWESSTLRSWLNKEFMNTAFTAAEAAMIAESTVTADRNPQYSTNPGNDTKDKLFLLSITEAEKLFTSDTARQCAPTAYAKAQGAFSIYKIASGEAACWWWLRSPGDDSTYAAYFRNDGAVVCGGYGVDYNHFCVRPALWINLAS